MRWRHVDGAPPPPGRPLEGLRVLLVDDHLDTLDLLAQALAHQGAVVVTARSARLALDVAGPFDAVVTDFLMSGEDGVWLLRQLRARGVTAPVVALSGMSMAHSHALASADFARVLLKPVDPWALGVEILALVPGR